MNTNHKRLKVFLMPEIKKVGLAVLASNLDKFPLFESFWT